MSSIYMSSIGLILAAVLTIFLSNVVCQQLDESTLVSVHVIVRDGHHYPDLHDIDKNPKYEGPMTFSPSTLTELGKEMMVDAGRKIREQYSDFLGSPALTRHLVSVAGVKSDVRRSRESALLILEGLRDADKESAVKREWGDSDLESVTKNDYTELATHFYRNCPKYKDEQNKILRKLLRFDIEDKYSKIMRALRSNTGLELKEEDLHDLYYLFSLYDAERKSELERPGWLTDELFEEFKRLMDDYVRASFHTDALKSMAGGLMVQRYFDILEARMHHPQSMEDCNKRMLVRTGQVSPLFASFAGEKGFVRMKDNKPMDFLHADHGGMIILETHQPNGSQDYYVKMFYSHDLNDNVNELKKPDCGYPCKANTLRRLLNDVAITRRDLNELCNMP